MCFPTYRLKAVAALFFLLSVLSPTARAKAAEHIIYSFSVGCGGPDSPLVFDSSGSLYGMTRGCVFELSLSPDGTWAETTLYNFAGSNMSGSPDALILDNAGNLYGTGYGGPYGGGVAFELSPSPSGTWTFTVLYSFGNGNDGFGPSSDLVFDSSGNLYGTTGGGGAHRGGTVFRLSPGPNGWTETILHSFGKIQGPGPSDPVGGVAIDSAGNLYGVTGFGGNKGGFGAAYELVPKNGVYKGRTIHSFDGYDGWEPVSGLTMDSSGNLYGPTSAGGQFGGGAVFQLTKGAKGKWAVTVLHSFGSGNDGFYPVGPMVFDQAGNLYGATMSGGGPYPATGTVYKLKQSHGAWTETILHVFDYGGTDGTTPYAGVIFNGGVAYGTTSMGGANNEGTVFSITP